MFPRSLMKLFALLSVLIFKSFYLAAVITALSILALSSAQSQQGQSSQQPASGQTQQQNQNSSPEAGGPKGDIGPIAIPKKSDAESKKPEPTPKPKPVE